LCDHKKRFHSYLGQANVTESSSMGSEMMLQNPDIERSTNRDPLNMTSQEFTAQAFVWSSGELARCGPVASLRRLPFQAGALATRDAEREIDTVIGSERW
jgi:hypothetical protein